MTDRSELTTVGHKTAELMCVLEQLAELLDSDGAHSWAVWMRKARAKLPESVDDGIAYLRSAYGGMGSFNDLVLGQRAHDGGFSWKPGYRELNEAFDTLRYQAAQLADEIRRARR